MKLPELLAPAGNHEKLITALHYGADAVYMGLSDFSLRAMAGNFGHEDLNHIAETIHNEGKKFYVTINIYPFNSDIEPIKEHLRFLKNVKPDGIIVSDPGVFDMAADLIPETAIHISTQANVTNYRAARFWEKLGAKRIVLARELSIDGIKEIRDRVSLELECFVHGAICISFSGRCYISSFMSNRSANLGACANSCRWNYTLMEEKRPGEHHPVYGDDRGTYMMSSKDLCMIEHLDKLADAGVTSFKIEGRMKGINYLAGVVKAYREAVDSLGTRPYRVKEKWLDEISMFSSRGYTTGMFFGDHPDSGYNHDEKSIYRTSHELVGVVRSVNNGKALVALRSNLKIGDTIEFLSIGTENKTFKVKELQNPDGHPMTSGRNENLVLLDSRPGVNKNDLIRRPLNHGSGQDNVKPQDQ